jgi:hypothetical protein
MQTNQEPLVSFEQAKGLKSIGFTWECEFYFMGSGRGFSTNISENHNRDMSKEKYSRPTISQSIRFFRIEKNLHGYIIPEDSEYGPDIYLVYAGPIKDIDFVCDCESHDLAASALLDKLIELTAPPSVTGDEK